MVLSRRTTARYKPPSMPHSKAVLRSCGLAVLSFGPVFSGLIRNPALFDNPFQQ